MAVLCIPWLRWKHPEWERPIKVNMIWPVLYILATVFITVVPMIAKPFETGMGCVIILTAVPVYFVFIYWKNKPTCIKKGLSINFSPTKTFQTTIFCLDSITVLLQKVLVVVAPVKKD